MHTNLQRSVLRLNKLGFDQVGDYVCRASYNGMFRYIRSYKVCVRGEHLYNLIVQYCSSIGQAEIEMN